MGHREGPPGRARGGPRGGVGRRGRVTVPFGRFRGALMIQEFTPLEPDLVELKLFARGVGPVLDLEVSGGTERVELLRRRRAARRR